MPFVHQKGLRPIPKDHRGKSALSRVAARVFWVFPEECKYRDPHPSEKVTGDNAGLEGPSTF